MRFIVSILLLVLIAGTEGWAGSNRFNATVNNDVGEFHDPFAEPEGKQIQDPLETVNRAFFRFNDLVYTRIFSPLCHSVSPRIKEFLAATRISFEKPLQIGETELKLAFRDGGSEAGRFILHTVLDLLHRNDPVTTQGLQNGEEDFGKVLQALGVDTGIYLVLPVLGPSSVRDGIGRITSFYLDPSARLCNPDLRQELSGETSLVGALKAYEEIRRQTLDPYLFIRDAYAQQLASAERKVHLTRLQPNSFPADQHKTVRHNAAFL